MARVSRQAVRFAIVLGLLAVTVFVIGQPVQGGAAQDVPTYALVNARIVPVSARPIIRGTLVLRDGRIAAMGPDVDAPPDAIVMDADGWTLYPGFVDAHATLGMPEPPQLPENNADQALAIQTRQRAGKATPGLTPQLAAVTSYEADPDALQAARHVGITAAAIAPRFGVVQGQSAIVTLQDGILGDQVVRGHWAQHIGFQRLRGEYPGTIMGVMASIRQHYFDARWYGEAWERYRRQPASSDRPGFDEALEALQASARGDQPVVFTAWTENEIHRALKLADELGLDAIISGAVEGWRALDALQASNRPVLVSLDLRPRRGPAGFGGGTGGPIDDPTVEDVEDAKANAGRLHSAGITVAFTGAGLSDPAEYLDSFRAVVDAGMSRDGALRALTVTPAEILGVDDVLGSLEVGKAANVVAIEGDIFDEDATVAAVWIDGERYDADAANNRRQRERKTDDEDDEDDDDAEPQSRAEAERRAPYGPLGGEAPVTAVRHATILTVANGTIERGTIVMEDGTITAVGPDAQVTVPAGARDIDATGMYVMPGIFDAHSHMAIEGGGNEGANSVTPEVRIIDVIDHRDPSLFRALAGGVTTINVLHGSANVIGGQNAIVKLRWGKSADEMLFEGAARGVKFALGENPKRSNRSPAPGVDPRYPGTRMGVEFMLRKSFADAREYRAAWQAYEEARARGVDTLAPRRDLRLEALVDIMAGDILVHAHSYRSDEILMLLRVAEDFGFRIASLQHVLEGYKVADEIAAHGAGASTFTDFWGYKMEAWDAIPYNMSIMYERGVTVSVNSDSGERVRRLYVEATKAVKYGGVPEDEALKMITLNAATHFGIDDRVGSIEIGKDGDLAIFTAHPFSGDTRVQYTLIDGQIYFDRDLVETTEDALAELSPATPGAGEGDLQQEVESTDSRFTEWTPPTLSPALRAEVMPPGYGDVTEPILFGDTTPIAIVGGRIRTMTGAPIPRGTVIIEAGRITAVGANVRVPNDAHVIDAEGMTVTPGMINAGTTIGLSEIGSVPGTNDTRELDEINAHIKASVAIHPHSEMIPIARANGVTTAIAAPQGGLVQGQSALIDMAGWTAPEVVARSPLAMHINFPERQGGGGFGGGGFRGGRRSREKVDAQRETLRDWMRRARAHAGALANELIKPTDQTYTLDALVPVVLGELPVVLEASSGDGITAALDFIEEFQLNGILAGTRDVWKVVDEIAETGVPVILGPIQATPATGDPYDAIFVAATLLHEAGVPFAFRTGGASAARNLPDHAALSVAFGLPREAAWHALTRGAAEILGVGDLYGSVEEGMIANLVVSEGDLLDIPSQVKHVLIRGQEVDLGTHHTRLWETFKDRPPMREP